MAKKANIDELWRQALVEQMKMMSNDDFTDLIRQREEASRPAPTAESLPKRAPAADKIPSAPRAESLPTTPPRSARDSIAAKREQARALGRTTL